MPIIGLLPGHSLTAALGHAARWIGAGLLIATGVARGQAGKLPADYRNRAELWGRVSMTPGAGRWVDTQL